MSQKPPQDDGILVPILTALMGGVGLFTLILIGGITFTYLRGPSEVANLGPPPAQTQSEGTRSAGSTPQSQTQPEQTPEPAEDLPETPVDNPVVNSDLSSEDDAMSTLMGLIESGVSNKFDGYSIDHDEDTITVNVWRESIDNTVKLLQQKGSDPNDEDWKWLKNNTKNSSDYIYDCIKTSELSNLHLTFNVLDSATQKTPILKILDESVAYDIMADKESSTAIERTLEETSGVRSNGQPQQAPPDTNQIVTPPPTSSQPANSTSPNSPEQSNGRSGWDTGTYSRDNWPQGKLLGSIDSDKYHCGNCRGAERIKSENEIWFNSEEEARAANYEPCGYCY